MIDRAKLIIGPLLVLTWGTVVFLSFFAQEIPRPLWMFSWSITLVGLVYFAVSQGNVTYILRRCVGATFTVLIIATLTFLLLRVVPGGPFDREKALPAEIKANIEAKYKLNDPLWMQYVHYLAGITRGDLGESYKYLGRNVADIIGEALPISIELGVYSLLLAYLIGIPAGVFAASRHNTWADSATMITAISGVSMPSFLVAPIFILLFCFQLNWFEPALWEGPAFYILPTVVLGTRSAAIIARLTRASVLEVIRSDYIRTARAKGLSEKVILFKHVLKNSLIPVLSFSGPLVAGILTGTFVVEQIFAIPGLGKHTVLSVGNRDYPLILGTTLVFSAALVVANLVVDILYSYFDPRIKLA